LQEVLLEFENYGQDSLGGSVKVLVAKTRDLWDWNDAIENWEEKNPIVKRSEFLLASENTITYNFKTVPKKMAIKVPKVVSDDTTWLTVLVYVEKISRPIAFADGTVAVAFRVGGFWTYTKEF
jgi:hypothetical protein